MVILDLDISIGLFVDHLFSVSEVPLLRCLLIQHSTSMAHTSGQKMFRMNDKPPGEAYFAHFGEGPREV